MHHKPSEVFEVEENEAVFFRLVKSFRTGTLRTHRIAWVSRAVLTLVARSYSTTSTSSCTHWRLAPRIPIVREFDTALYTGEWETDMILCGLIDSLPL